MFDKIIAYSIKNKFIIGVLVAALIGIGIHSLRNLPIDALPDITNNQVQIITTSPNLATQEVELFITYPIELAVKSIPEIVELRSISRFGLSLITVVFEEDTDIYWARSQITERLKQVDDEIPIGFGTPELAPISTGLGEILQYTLSAEKGYESSLTAMELRTVQDWLIVPQLLGTKGVAEVNTLGGILKEYEVAVNPNLLKSMGVTMSEIFTALKNNNENTGGAYIDKKPYAYFIRSLGMINSLDDITKIVVKTKNDIPILIQDVAQVQFGSTVRYGATTKDGKGEVVSGMVLMLKGENSAEIVTLVKDKLEQIKKTLPEGVVIAPFLDRTKLVNKAIATIRTNLLEGALIVIFILVLLIGNWRAGLVVASVIPLSLLFAVSLMRLFGVSGNLMSLGAIDFGLIVDGAVIIVESIVHRLQHKTTKVNLTQQEMDEEVYTAASKIRSSAAFGEIIILIVYLPILALVGIEGKMFTPMAQTVAFAILGAFILSLTYVPMMSALCLKRTTSHKTNLSDRIMNWFQCIYQPILAMAMKMKLAFVAATILLFVFSMYVFSGLGGEFIPTLFEGDLATHVIIPPGSSLQQEIETTTKAEQLLLANFPEIEQVVSKIGSAEVPTDPMPMEVADVMIILKDKSEWTSASSKHELFEKMEHVLDDLPGVTTEFTQPIQMRFNELMTGVRSDVGIKIFGDDLDLLVSYGDELVEIVQTITGVEDARAEAVRGFPQITVDYDKDKLALYGLTVSDLNETVSMGFAGKKAGVIYEQEKKFDLVVRLQEPYRQSISNIKEMYVSLPSGNQIPLEQVADISHQKGPAQISRENGKRRIIVGFNVRNRDVESVVDEIQTQIDTKLDLPSGYYVEYAGQFENLKRAKERLSIAVPLALALILILLYFTFQSVHQTLLIFTAIPLSAIGGVFALYLRGMPFSISAGIGFIALFGVAVLNGIVLISYFNQLKSEGMKDIMQRIKVGTSVRLRPVIMTASVASLGFLPMALSTNAGAEVQKPLATVVIGGLLTATFLTLIILPILYFYTEKSKWKSKMKSQVLLFIFLLFGVSQTSIAQESRTVSLQEAITILSQSNPLLLEEQLHLEQLRVLEDSYQIPKMEFSTTLGQVNSKSFDHGYSVNQNFNPFLKKATNQLAKEVSHLKEYETDWILLQLKMQLKSFWNEYTYLSEQEQLLQQQKELIQDFLQKEERKFELGESNRLRLSRAELKVSNYEQYERINQAVKETLLLTIQQLVGQPIQIETNDFALISNDETEYQTASDHPLLLAVGKKIQVIESTVEQNKAAKKPEFMVGYFIQSIQGNMEVDGVMTSYNATPRFQGAELGMNIPIFSKGYNRQIEAKEIETKVMIQKSKNLNTQLDLELNRLQITIEQAQINIGYFQENALPNATLIRENSEKSYHNGNIDYAEFVQALTEVFETEQEYLQAIKEFNQLIIEMETYTLKSTINE